jgi:hypothetical protein
MKAIAGCRLRDLADYRVDISLNNAAEHFVALDLALDSREFDAKCLTRDLHDGIPNRWPHAVQGKDPRQAIDANGCHLDRSPIFHSFDQRDQTAVDKIEVLG